MKLASLREGGRDGTLVVVERNLQSAVPVPHIAPTLQAALDDWPRAAPALAGVYERLNGGDAADALPFDAAAAASPLPRAHQWIDASAYVHHMELLRRARGADMPEDYWHEPLIYQGGSDAFLGPTEPMAYEDEDWGLDFEAELAVITGDVPMGTPEEDAGAHIRLLMLVNDVSLRGLIAAEIAKGFGFFQSKPASAFSPVAATADELGTAWDGSRVHLPLLSHLNGALFGNPDAGADMVFAFPRLIAHAARTRPLGAGTIIGSGTVSNRDRARGSSCIAERRALETIADGAPRTPFLHPGDRVRIEMPDTAGRPVFGAIDQRVERARG